MEKSRLEVDSWLATTKSFAIRQKALERECAQDRLRYKDELALNSKNSFLSNQEHNEEINDFRHEIEEDISKWQRQLRMLRKYTMDAPAKFKTNQLSVTTWTLFENLLKRLKDDDNDKTLIIEAEQVCLDSFLKSVSTKVEMWTVEHNSCNCKSNTQDASFPKKITRRMVHEATSNNTTNFNIVQNIDLNIAKVGGTTGYWHQDDHSAFLRAYTRVKKNKEPSCILSSCRKYVQGNLKHKSDEDILEHCKWYQTYLRRCREKSELARTWREEQQQSIAIVKDITKQKNNDTAHDKEETDSRNDHRREQIQATIRAWKEEKQRKAELENERKMKFDEDKENTLQQIVSCKVNCIFMISKAIQVSQVLS